MAKLGTQDNIGGRVNKTSICSVVFLDIIDCSLKPVSEQIENKECFNALLGAAIKNVAESDRIILDTGDGAVIALMGAPEDGLFAALSIRDGILQHNRESSQQLYVRIGINLGPVIVVNDINGRLNILGDGINVAQRIMSFAGSNQIMVSRSYYEVTSRLTEEITGMFVYSGIKHDKHVREHEVYIIRPSNAAAPVAAYDAQYDASHPGTSKQGFVHAHWLGLTFACLAAAVFVSVILVRAAASGTAIPPVSSASRDTAVSPAQSRAAQVEPAWQPTTYIDSAAPQSMTDATLDAERKNGDRQPADKKSALLNHEAEDDAGNLQYSDLEEKETDRLSWQSLTKSFKQGRKNKKCSETAKMLNQCRE